MRPRTAVTIVSRCSAAESSTAAIASPRYLFHRARAELHYMRNASSTPFEHSQPRRRTLHVSAQDRSGHNRWSKIRHRKGAADAQRSAIFSRLTNDIHAALRPPASPDPVVNSRLATALAKAREGGVPKAVVENCFTRARAAADGTGQSVVYEAIGPGGREAMMIETLTDSPARTVQRLKEILHKKDCRIAPVAYLFEKKGIITVTPGEGAGFDELFELAVEGGAEDVRDMAGTDDPMYEIITPPADLSAMTTMLSAPAYSARFPITSSDLCYVPVNPLEVIAAGEEGDGISEERADDLEKVVDALTLEGDVVKVWTNLA